MKTIKRAIFVIVVLAIPFALLGISQSALAEVFKWVDDKGTIHFTEDPSTIPEKFKNQLERRSLPEDSNIRKGEHSDSFDVVDFIDNTKKYAGRTLKMRLNLYSSIFGDKGQSLQNYTGSSVNFGGYFGKSRLDVRVYIPKSLAVPKATYGDSLDVSFICRDGDLRNGNEAISISRP
jgi:hypothetical protein